MTIRDLMSDIKATLGLGIDDAEWSDGPLLYNIGLAIDKLQQQHIARQMSRGQYNTLTNEVSTFTVPVQTDTTYNRRYFTLPGPIYDLPFNGGIDYIAYFRNDIDINCTPQVALVQYEPMSWREFALLKEDPLQAPSPQYPRYIRSSDNNVYLFGQDPMITSVEVGLYLSFPELPTVNIDDKIPLPPALVFDLRRILLQMGNWLMLQPHERLLNDGRANNVGERVQPAPPLMSINNPTLNDVPD